MVTSNIKNLELVQFERSDISGLVSLSASVGWDYDENEIGTVFSSGKIFGHKNAEGKIVSSAAIISYDNGLASIGMVIVHKECRGMGLGKEVTKKCIKSVSDSTSIMLISTEEGRVLYERLGFKIVDCVHKYICENYQSTKQLDNSQIRIENYRESDYKKIVRLDGKAFGDCRSHFLTNRISQAEKRLVVKDHEGEIVGFGLAIQGPVNLILGPIAAPDFQTALLLIDKLSSGHQGNIRIDVPSGNEEFMMILENCGFVKVSQPPIMIHNSHGMPARNNTLFGIAAQVFG